MLELHSWSTPGMPLQSLSTECFCFRAAFCYFLGVTLAPSVYSATHDCDLRCVFIASISQELSYMGLYYMTVSFLLHWAKRVNNDYNDTTGCYVRRPTRSHTVTQHCVTVTFIICRKYLITNITSFYSFHWILRCSACISVREKYSQ